MRLLAILFLFLSLGAFSQKNEVFQIDYLRKEGILLDKGWKWHAGDNPDFAKADFDDTKWNNINPNYTIPELPNIDTKQPLWLRIKFNSNSKKEVAFSIKQSSASEIYLNGKLIKKYGKINQYRNGTIAYVPFDEYLISNIDSLSNTLSIRIFFQKGIRYKQFQDIFYPLFTCQIYGVSELPKYPHLEAYIGEGFNIGVPLILFLVYFTIFLFYKPNKSNLWFSLWGASTSLTAFLALLSKLTTQISLQNTYTNWASIFSSFGTICLIFSIYLLLNQKRIWFIVGFIILVTISTLNYFLPNNSDPRIFDFVILIFYIGLIVYMSLNAIKSGNKGGKYVIIGIIFFIVFWTIFIFDLLGFNKSTLIAGVNYHIAALSLPIIVATLLGLEFRNTNKSLLKNLEDVKNLSAEKQQILTTQNETLETQVTERTAELVHKNRDLEIEGALERVRSSSLAIQQSHELEKVVVVLFNELRELGLIFDSAFIYIFEKSAKNIEAWVASIQLPIPIKVIMPYDKDIEHNPIITDLWHAIENGEHGINKSYKEKDKDDYYKYEAKYNKSIIPESITNLQLEAESWTTTFASEKNSIVGIDSWAGHRTTIEDFHILKRFAKVFEQAYIRFLDLQKAEAQAREAHIELALERVRAKTMAMQKSQELREVAAIIFEQLQLQGFNFGALAIVIMDDISGDSDWWMSGFGNDYPEKYKIPFFNHRFYLEQLSNWKEGKKYAVMAVSGLEKKIYDEYIFSQTDFAKVSQEAKNVMCGFEEITFSNAYMKHGALSWGITPINEEDARILQRFAIVFEQTYTRFLDLQKAEAQAREAQIEVALEKIRSRSLAMHHSDELKEVMGVMFKKLTELEILIGTVGILLFDEKTKNCEFWLQNQHQEPGLVKLPYDEKMMKDNYMGNYWAAKAKGESFYNKKENIEQKNRHFEYVFTHNDTPQPVQEYLLQAQYHTQTFVIEKNSTLLVDSWDERIYSEEQIEVIKRVAKVFEQAYIRFLDLQKAEAQAREAQIEAALERVRSRTMAMQKSDELGDASLLLDSQVRALGIKTRGCGFNIYGENESTEWFSSEMGTMPTYKTPRENIFLNYYEAGQRGETLLINKFTTEECILHYEYLCSLPVTGEGLRQFKANGGSFPIQQIDHVAYFKYGYLLFITLESVPEAHDIFKRFAKVFEQTYTRFLDLQKAEAQAREALIEASLERIRSRAMAMNTSEEFNSLIGFIYVECTKLNMHLDRGFIMTFDKATKDAYWWMVGADASDKPLKILVEYHDYAPNLAIVKGWEEREQRWIYILEGNNKKTWDDYQFANALSQLPEVVIENMRSVESVILNASFQNFGCIMLSSFVPLTDDQFDLIQRFSKVFDQTYTRFLDLQKAETQAREAQIEASFERIRASALAMQTSNEFLGVVKTLYEQINALGQKELEATIIQFYDIEQGFINSWNAQNINKSSAGNITLGTAHIPFDACLLTLEWLKAYQSTQEDYTIIAKDDILKEWLQVLITLSPEIKDHLGDTLPQISNFHFSKFSRGALSMVSQKPFSEESKYLLKRAASAFDLAYKRFLDLQQKEEQAIKLAEEKLRLEDALRELQTTQAQLIQKEKLASLGELTAGIAHEIQNPLNFVNNFSELSVELANELKTERLKVKGQRDEELENELVEDLIQNQEKINLHGKRASSIVKGMLEHSRVSTGAKEITDINALADEYLRLAYHGLRAKDHTFNADFRTDLDEKLPKVEVIPQDIGRVLLNLINNAFYATKGVKNPLVEIKTASVENGIIVSVKDNGKGMSEETKAKIFQPFFTTKPTGEGTGLGLSLAYDIITKGHGGTIEVESKEGFGTTFMIKLPFS